MLAPVILVRTDLDESNIADIATTKNIITARDTNFSNNFSVVLSMVVGFSFDAAAAAAAGAAAAGAAGVVFFVAAVSIWFVSI